MRVRILGKFWNLRFAPNMANDGDCDPPAKPGKEIRVSSSTEGERRLAVLVHEMLHCADWHKDEAWVEIVADDIARVLWRLNYRNVPPG